MKYALTSILILLISVTPAVARSGCCSHHGGVCGCGCCDGTSLSSTCAPYYPSCGGSHEAPIVTAAPTRVYTPAPTRIYTPAPTKTPTPTKIITPTEEEAEAPTPSSRMLVKPTTPAPTKGITETSGSDGGGGLLTLLALGGGVWYWKSRSKKTPKE
ncbi:MAG: hypothetical protein ACD_61C00040G0007 [uncultured bacterium]|nr:MAG: hypothetical protein ACD_61C00040G0007 [uncultured bacterium]